jgi:hypothetical protein
MTNSGWNVCKRPPKLIVILRPPKDLAVALTHEHVPNYKELPPGGTWPSHFLRKTGPKPIPQRH